MKNIYLLPLFLIFLVACDSKENHSLKLNFPDKQIVIAIDDIESKENRAIVYADLLISDYPSTVNSIDLNCIVLTYENIRSDAIYVDNIASVQAGGLALSSAGTTKVPVYWVMSGVTAQELNAGSFKAINICAKQK